MNIRIEKTTTPAQKPDQTKLGFGRYFTDHMFLMDYSPDKGWHDARIVPFANLTLHPAATVFHYGAEVFEGMKAYRRADGQVQLFRPMENVRRLNTSAERLCLPQIDEQDALEAEGFAHFHGKAQVPVVHGVERTAKDTDARRVLHD